MHDLVDALQRGFARGRVADVSTDQLDAGGLEVVRDRLLPVQETVENANPAPGGEQLATRERSDISGSAGDERGSGHGSHHSGEPDALSVASPRV